jgi:hypothetical protein
MTVFIGRPVLHELKQWGQRRDRIAASPRARIWPWLLGGLALARVVPPGRYDVQAYVAADDIWRLKPDAPARFVPNGAGQPSRAARLVEASSSAAATLDQPLLASTNGGAIAVSQDAQHRLKPRAALYPVRLVTRRDTRESGYAVQATPGRIVIDAAGESLIAGCSAARAGWWPRKARSAADERPLASGLFRFPAKAGMAAPGHDARRRPNLVLSCRRYANRPSRSLRHAAQRP